ncbi:hypothetical protein V6W80_17240 [Pseudomonas benzopyrenica]|uniref:SPW repeat-containing protein n=1 Tax=Pseudomonas benzopyrenica TaxID=2993566 RepID=A0ABZ2FML5_9PSED
MKTPHIVSTAISVALSTCLLIGEPWHWFGFYTLLAFNILAWIGLLSGGVKGETASKIREGMWLSCASTAFQLYALIVTGHPILAAVSFICSALIVTAAYRQEVPA